MRRTQETHSFKEGDTFHLDRIYDIQGLAGGDWWKRACDDIDGRTDADLSDHIVCVRTVKIKIIVESA